MDMGRTAAPWLCKPARVDCKRGGFAAPLESTGIGSTGIMLVSGLGAAALTWALADWTPAADLMGQTFSIVARLGTAHGRHPALVFHSGSHSSLFEGFILELSIRSSRMSGLLLWDKLPLAGRYCESRT